MKTLIQRRLPVGAEAVADGTHFRVWCPAHERIAVVIHGAGDAAGEYELEAEPDGYFSAYVAGATHGARYRFRLADGRLVPDPAARFQPDGPHGASQVIDPQRFGWTDETWTGPAAARHVAYELHIGTFTQQGTWRAAAERLPDLAQLGITLLEVMPVAEFPGRFNWGYDGVAPFAPAHVYGGPDDMRVFVDRAHALGLAVILDVVYNHMGPDGCYLRDFADEYFSTRHHTDWGDALNFDGPGAQHVREFFLANIEYWIREFHVDGARIDATQNIYDDSAHHFLAALTERARAAAGARRTWIVAENEPQDTRMVRPPARGGFDMDAAWNDDFHHSAVVAVTGRAEAYFSDHRGTPQELISSAKFGFLYQGQYYTWQKQARGTSAFDLPARCFVNYLQSHDQIANSVSGRRLHQLTSPGEYRAITALLLLMPGTAMLFQGQEFAASSPFLFFADHEPALARQVHAGRREFLAQFPSISGDAAQVLIDDPAAPDTFLRCRLDHGERATNAHVLRLHRDLIRLSREDPVFAAQDATRLHGAVLGERALALRFFTDGGDDRLFLLNLGTELALSPAPEPLLAPPRRDRHWTVIWSSDDPRYGGDGAPEPEMDRGWRIAARSATVLAPGRGARPLGTQPEGLT